MACGICNRHIASQMGATFFAFHYPSSLHIAHLPLPFPFNCHLRLSAEERIQDLQWMIDETFGQFAIDDSEDDFEEDSPDDATCNGEALDSSRTEKKSSSIESQV